MVLQKCNLVVLGRTGVGKSTVVNHILGHEKVFQVSTSLEGVTRERRTSEEETERNQIKDVKKEVEYNIKIIDTVGLRDVKIDAEMIMKEIQGFIKRKALEGVHLILFVMRKGVFYEDEKNAFESIVDGFKNNQTAISALVVTGCEGLSDEGREDEILAIKNGPDTKTFASFMSKGIYPVGFPSVDDLKPSLREEYKKDIKNDAEELRKLVFDCTDVISAWQPNEKHVTSKQFLISAVLVLGVALLVYDATRGAKYTRRIFLFVQQYLGLI